MTIYTIIITLGLQVIFAEKMPSDYICGYYQSNTKEVVLNLASWCNQNETLYHELGHALFLNDKEVKDFISKYPAPKFYYSTDYPTANSKLNEKVADYFAMYMKYPDFGKKFPEVKELFDRKVKDLTETVSIK